MPWKSAFVKAEQVACVSSTSWAVFLPQGIKDTSFRSLKPMYTWIHKGRPSCPCQLNCAVLSSYTMVKLAPAFNSLKPVNSCVYQGRPSCPCQLTVLCFHPTLRLSWLHSIKANKLLRLSRQRPVFLSRLKWMSCAFIPHCGTYIRFIHADKHLHSSRQNKLPVSADWLGSMCFHRTLS